MFDRLELAPVILDSVTANASGVREEELKLQDNGFYNEIPNPCFFDPSMSNINDSPTNFSPDGNYNHHKAVRALIEEYTHNPSSHESIQMLANEISWEFCSYPRLRTRRDRHSLRSLTKWILSGYVFPLPSAERGETSIIKTMANFYVCV